MDHKEGFHFTYSAAQQQEIENIRNKYLPQEPDKMAQLRTLHRSAGQRAQSAAITVGVIGTLILGSGMSLAMTDLGTVFGLSGSFAMVLGILIGLVGLVLVALAYPLYEKRLKKERARIAPEILRLSDELLQ